MDEDLAAPELLGGLSLAETEVRQHRDEHPVTTTHAGYHNSGCRPVNSSGGQLVCQTRPVDSAELAADRLILLVRQLTEEGMSQRKIGDLLGVSQASISGYLSGTRRPGMTPIAPAMDNLKVHRDFFFDPSLGDDPHYRDFCTGEVTRKDPPHWAEFRDTYMRFRELSDEDRAAMKSFAIWGRDGIRIRSVYDWITLAEWVLNHKPSKRFEESGESEG